jgi:histidyl-tRNA synthetase
LGVTDAQPHVNSLGCPACRPAFRQALLGFLADRQERLCADCLRRRETNPLRILDCKVPQCRETSLDAPALMNFLCPECQSHFATLQQALDELGIAYIIDKRLVRGLDYYSRTTFEIQTTALGAQSAVAGGGRYDGLMQTLGGPDIAATGFAIGFDRLAEIVAAQRKIETPGPALFIAALGETARVRAFPWLTALNRRGINAEMVFEDKSLKSLMKRAGKQGAQYVLIIGEQELADNSGQLRDMTTREQIPLALDKVVEALQQRLRDTA